MGVRGLFFVVELVFCDIEIFFSQKRTRTFNLNVIFRLKSTFKLNGDSLKEGNGSKLKKTHQIFAVFCSLHTRFNFKESCKIMNDKIFSLKMMMMIKKGRRKGK